MVYSGKTPPIPFKTLQEWGAARVSVPVASIFAAAGALERAFTMVLNDEGEKLLEDSYDFQRFTDLVGLPGIKELEKKFLDDTELAARYTEQK